MAIDERDIVLHRFYENVRARPDDVWLSQPQGQGRIDELSFKKCLDEARRMAAYLRSLGLPPKSNIAMVSKNCAHFYLADLAIWMAGHVSVALYPTLTFDTVQYILEHSGSRLLFVGKLDLPAWEEMRKGIPAGLPAIAFPLAPATDYPAWNDIVARHEPIADEPRVKPDELSLIIYTSGSTGRPKGVVHNFESISSPTQSLIALLGINSKDRYLSYLPLAHAMDRWLSECVSMVTGHRIFFAESLETFVEDLKRARPTLFLSVPRLWLKFQLGVFSKMPEPKLKRLLRIPILSGVVKRKILTNLGLDQVRLAASGSAPIPAELLQWYRNLGLELLEGYGMSENFNYSHLSRPGRGRAGYIGHAYDDVRCKLSPDGEILVKSPGMMVGYFREPEMTREVFTEDGFLRTGDRGEIDSDGQLKITGRVKDLFKTSKGKYVAPVPIENRLNSHNCIELSCVAGAGQSATHAVVQLAEHIHARLGDPKVRQETEHSLAALLDQVNRELPIYEQMEFIAVANERWSVESGLLTPTLKLKRTVIEEHYQPLLKSWYESGKKVIWQG